jgi:hypothetical protein
VPKHNKWKHADMKKHLLQFYALRSNSLRKFHKDHLATTNIPRNTFQRHWREINLKSLQEKNGNIGIAKAAIENYLPRTDKNKSTQVAGAIESRRYLSMKEEEALVHLAFFLERLVTESTKANSWLQSMR